MARRYALVKVKAIEEITPLLLERRHQGTIDMAIVVLPMPGSELLHLELFAEQLYAVLPPKHPLAGKKESTLSDINQEPVLLLKEGHCFRDSVFAACRQSKVMPTIVFESGQFSAILAWSRRGWASPWSGGGSAPRPGCRFVQITGKRNTK